MFLNSNISQFILLTAMVCLIGNSNGNLTTITKVGLKFTELVRKMAVAEHFENITVHHPFWIELGEGTLHLDKFKAMIQQDDLWLRNYFKAFKILADREQDPELKKQLTAYGNESMEEAFSKFYEIYNFTSASQMVPGTLGFSSAQLHTSKYKHIGVGLAFALPCYTIWTKIGYKIAELNSGRESGTVNPYQYFIDKFTPNDASIGKQKAYEDFVNGYYERLGNDIVTKKKMVDAYTKGIQYEYQFVDTCYNLTPEMTPPPKFSHLIEYVAPEQQRAFENHPMFIELAAGKLLLTRYGKMIQQDDLFLRAFYRAFELMEEKETNPEYKKLLKKNPAFWNGWMESQYKKYGFSRAHAPDPATSEYIDHIMRHAEYGTVAEGLAAVYPYYFMWEFMGRNALVNATRGPNHPYKMFLDVNDPPTTSSSYEKFSTLINGYFDRLGDNADSKSKMFSIVEKSVYLEFHLINSDYLNGAV